MRWDARSKILLVLSAGLTYGMALTMMERFCLVGFLSLLLLLAQNTRVAFLNLAGFSFFYLLYQTSFLPVWLTHLALIHVHVWVPIMAGHFLLSTTTSYDLIQALRKWHLPEAFLLTLAVMFRFLPLIKEDIRVILSALKSRGIFLSRQPHRFFDYLLVPLMMSLLRTSQDLTTASLTKGLALEKKPTSFIQSSWTILDWSLCLCSLSFLLWKLL